MALLGLLVLVLAVVHQLDHRRLGRRRNFHQINVAFFRQRQTFTQTDDTELLAFFSYQTDLAGGNFAIDPWFAFLSYSQYSCSLVIVPVGTQT
ncbi:hypothetical protein D3C85_1304230 [compost metagenome]